MLKDHISVIKFNILNKMFLSNEDIGILMGCSISKASGYRKLFLKIYDDEPDFFEPRVRTSDFLKHYKIDVERIKDNYRVIHQLAKEERSNASLQT